MYVCRVCTYICVNVIFFSFSIVGVIPVPEIDLAFAISATSASSPQTFKLMKDTIKFIVGEYNTDKIHYSVILYGNVPTTPLRFSDQIPTAEDIKKVIDRLSPERFVCPFIVTTFYISAFFCRLP